MRWIHLAWVAIGGAFGAVLRIGIGLWIQRNSKSEFPWGTLLVNLIGCFLIGILFVLLNTKWKEVSLKYLFIGGFCGSFTTFSAFSMELFLLMKGIKWKDAIFYFSYSILLGIIMVWLGIWIGFKIKPYLP